MSTKAHNNIILKLGVGIAAKDLFTIKEIGEFMQNTGADKFSNGGFWLYGYESNDCYLSDKFLQSLGYSRDEIKENVEFFYKVANNEHLNIGFEMLNKLIEVKSETSFINYLNYTKKDKSILNVECSGTPLYKDNKPYIILGTHAI
jgi:hypothetical protein